MIGKLRMLRYEIWRQGMRVLLTVAVLATLGGIGHLVLQVEGRAEAGQPATATSDQADAQRLVGRWVRPDGGYILELREVAKEGSLKAAYFNPRSINVARAQWRRKDGVLAVLVELHDANYPGSTYTLQYDPASDRLKEAYFQAVEKQTFGIEFVRKK